MKKLLLVIFTTIISNNVLADCSKGNVYEDLACYEKQIKQDKTKMNKVYQTLNQSLDSEGQKQLELSQKAWLAYREAQCEGLMGYYGSQAQGAGAALIQSSCLSEKLSERLNELKELAE